MKNQNEGKLILELNVPNTSDQIYYLQRAIMEVLRVEEESSSEWFERNTLDCMNSILIASCEAALHSSDHKNPTAKKNYKVLLKAIIKMKEQGYKTLLDEKESRIANLKDQIKKLELKSIESKAYIEKLDARIEILEGDLGAGNYQNQSDF